MESNLTLFNLSAEMAAIENALIESGGELTPEIEQALTTTSDALAKKADDYGAVINKFQSIADAADAEIKRLQAIKRTADNSAKNIKAHLASTMNYFDLKQLEGSTHKFTLVKTSATEVDEERLLQPHLAAIEALQARLPKWINLKATVSKTELKAYKDADVKPDGVNFVENLSLRIR